MIDRIIGNRAGGGDGFGRNRANDNPANKAGAGGGGNAVNIVKCHLGFGKCRGNDIIDHVQMRPRGNFGHNTTMFGMCFDL